MTNIATDWSKLSISDLKAFSGDNISGVDFFKIFCLQQLALNLFWFDIFEPTFLSILAVKVKFQQTLFNHAKDG